MIIECTIKRPRTVQLGEEAYSFEKDENGRYVAEVEDQEHIDLLLDIRCYRKLATTPAAVKKQAQSVVVPPASTVATAPAAAASIPVNPLAGKGLGTIAPNGDDASGGEGSEGNGEGEGEGEGDDKKPALDRAKLAADYEAKFGKKPHHSQSAERIQQLLNEED